MPRKTDQDRLLDAAARVFARRGYHAARVSEIAREAGVAQGTVYLYAESKEQLYLALLERFAQRVRVASAQLGWTGIGSAADLRAQFAHLYTGIFELCATDRATAGLLFGGPLVTGRSLVVRSELLRAAEAITSGYLEAGIRAGLLRPLDTTTVSRAIVGLLLHTVLRTIVEEGRSDCLRALADELLDFELEGLLAPVARTRPDDTIPSPAAPAGS